jgi:hypothetical protein
MHVHHLWGSAPDIGRHVAMMLLIPYRARSQTQRPGRDLIIADVISRHLMSVRLEQAGLRFKDLVFTTALLVRVVH